MSRLYRNRMRPNLSILFCTYCMNISIPTSPSQPPWVLLAATILQHVCPSLHPAQTLYTAFSTPTHLINTGLLLLPPSTAQPNPIPPGPIRRLCFALQALGPPLPPSRTPPPPSTIGSAIWPRSHLAQPLTVTPPSSVRAICYILNAPARTLRRSLHLAYIQLAFSPPTPPHSPNINLTNFLRNLSQLWRMPFPNSIKEPLWRTAINANPGSHFRPWHCPCCNPQIPSHSSSPREHTFWSCPVALHLRNAITSAMGPRTTGPPVEGVLLAPPSPTHALPQPPDMARSLRSFL